MRLGLILYANSITSTAEAITKSIPDGLFASILLVGNNIDINDEFPSLKLKEKSHRGEAMKQGLLQIDDGSLDGMVFAEGDGSVSLEDILAIAKDFESNSDTVHTYGRKKEKGIHHAPYWFSRLYFSLASKQKIVDVNPPLMAVPSFLFGIFKETKGKRFDFQHSFLLEAAHQGKIQEKIIEAKKGENGYTYQWFLDFLLLYRSPLLYGIVSLTSWGIDVLGFYLFHTFLFTWSKEAETVLSYIVARVISGTYNFAMFNFVVFPKKGDIAIKAFKYSILFLINMGIASGLTYLFSHFVPGELTFIKIIVDTILAIANYFINHSIVFARKKIAKKK